MHRNRTKGALLAATLAGSLAGAAPATAADVARPALQALPFPASGTARTTEPFSLLGVTWADPSAEWHGTVRVRTRSANSGRWSRWQSLEADGSLAGDHRGATDPLWVGASNGVQARIEGAHGPLPTDLRLDLINPDAPAGGKTQIKADETGRMGSVESRGVDTGAVVAGAPAGVGAAGPGEARAAGQGRAPAGRVAASGRMRGATVPLPARPVPRMVTRAGWGANESIVRAAPSYTGPIQVFFVHHTATGNGYSCAESAGVVRGIQAYQVRSKGWDDIGYNFLIDKCGTIFEGRGGGVGRPVLGAHTLGFNTDASAIAVIGNYDAAGVSAKVRTAIATVAAYKLGAYGHAPNGKVVLTSGGGNLYPKGARAVLFRISGHRDAGRTECPGTALYAQLPAIRAIAGAAPAGLRFLRMTGATAYGTLLFSKGQIRPLWDVDTPSALINRFEVWVDGRLTLAAPGSHRTAALALPKGGHTVVVRAMHLSGRTTSVTAKIVSDANAPVFSAGPDVVLRPGSLDGSVPIRLNWTAFDVNGLASVVLVRPTSVNLGTTGHARNGTIKPGAPATFAVRATDHAGNAVNASVTRTPVVLSEAAAQRTGTWRTLRNQAYLGGVALGATAGGSTATWTFTGRSAALAVGRGALSGRVRIFADGVDQGIVDLGSPRTLYRQAIWTRWWSTSGEHTVRVQVEGTPGRPGVVLDGLVYLK